MYLLQVELLPKLLHFFVVLPFQYGISMISRRSTLTATSNLHQPEVQSVTPFRCTFHCCHLMSSSVSFIFLRAFYRAEFFNFSLPERLNFSLLQFSVPASFRAVTCFSNFTFSHFNVPWVCQGLTGLRGFMHKWMQLCIRLRKPIISG